MNFREFFLLCDESEKEILAIKAKTTVANLRQLAHKRKCSPWKAYFLECASEEMAKVNPRLRKMSCESIVRNPKEYRTFLSKVRGAAA